MAFDNQYIRLMVVDYDNEYLQQTKDMFSDYGEFKVSYLSQTSREAISIAQNSQPDIALISHALLDANGLDVAQEIKKVSPKTICYLVSDRPNIALWERAQSLGIKKMLNKPLDVRELVAVFNTDMSDLRESYRSQDSTMPWNNRDVYSNAPKIQSIRKTVAMIISPKGGVGKTTMAVNMAVAAAMQNNLGLKVAIVDLNEFGTVTIHLNLGTPENLLNGEGMARNVLQWEHVSSQIGQEELREYMVQHKSGLWVVPSVPQPEMIGRVTEDLIIKIINTLRNFHDLVIIDLPPSINLEVSWATTAIVDYILLVVTPDVQCIPGMSQINKTLTRLEVEKKCYRIVNMDGIAGGLSAEELDKFMPYPVIGVIPEDGKVRQAVKVGVPLMMSEPNGEFAYAVKTALNKIFPVFNDMYIEKPKKSGLLRKLFGLAGVN
jgi:pilus assembly protein CpaE